MKDILSRTYRRDSGVFFQFVECRRLSITQMHFLSERFNATLASTVLHLPYLEHQATTRATEDSKSQLLNLDRFSKFV